ncbi:MAG: transglutaminase domain-containing protein [Clostridia bacterium]
MMKKIFLYILVVVVALAPLVYSNVSRDTIVTEVIEKSVPVEGMYNVPFVEKPSENGYTSVYYFEDVILYMMVNDIYEYTCTLKDVASVDAEADTVFDLATIAFEDVVAKYHEYGCFYENIDFELSSKGSDIMFTIKIFDIDNANEQITYKKDKFFEEINSIVAEMYASGDISESDTDYKKAQYFYRWCAYNMKYDNDMNSDSFTGYGALMTRTAICQGYTAVFNALCNSALIECVGVTGIANNGPHIWSYANLDGRWYYIDVTFGDPMPDRANYCDETYFAVTERELEKTHTFDK